MPEVLPPLFQKWIDKLLPGGIPNETRATCSNCAMVPKGEPVDSDISFNPQTKCCTYYPDLANFICGRIFADDRPENYTGRRVLERRIQARANVSPLGISPPQTYSVLYSTSALQGPDVFGRSASLQCPFYIQHFGECGIHQHRETVCSTFYCKYSRGAVGRTFWRALAKLLGNVEHAVRVWALDQVEPSGALSDTALSIDGKKRALDEFGLAGAPPPGQYERLWGPYLGREVDVYRACAEHVAKLDIDDAIALGGVQTVTTARLVKRLHQGLLRTELPAKVTRGSNHLIQISRVPKHVRLKSNTALYDFVDVPDTAVPAAARILDRPLEQARADLAAEGLELDDETLRWMLDFEILVPA